MADTIPGKGVAVGTTATQTLYNKTMSGSSITGATIYSSTFTGGLVYGANLSNCTGISTVVTTLTGVTIGNSTLTGTTTNSGTISGGTITGTSISGSTVSGGTVTGSTLYNSIFSGTTSGLKGVYNQQLLDNLGLTASVASKALVVSLKGADGNDPSASNPVTIAFRSASLTTGTTLFRTVTAAASITLSSGSTLGFTAALAGRLYVWAIDNAGTIEMALSRTADIFPEQNVVTTTAEGGAGAADSAAIMYSASARANVACRCLGYVEITTGATAGEWDNAPTKVQVMGVGVKRSGDLIQTQRTISSAWFTGLTVIPFDDTIPQIGEGDQLYTCAITPTSAINRLEFNAFVHGQQNDAVPITGALFQVGTANAMAAITTDSFKGNQQGLISIYFSRLAGTASATTFSLRIGPSSLTGTRVNGNTTSRLFGGVYYSGMTIAEIFE